MKVAYFDCFSGISGDMILGALVDAGLDPEQLRSELAKLSLPGLDVTFAPANKQGIAATRAEVTVGEDAVEDHQHLILDSHAHGVHRHLSGILNTIRSSGIDETAKESAQAIFKRLAEAEAHVHGVPPEQVHLHEVGAADAIADIVGAVVGLSLLGVEEIYSSPLRFGTGYVQCAHGRYPVPVPGVLALCKDVPAEQTGVNAELVTPTGAAIITTLCRGYGMAPPMRLSSVGYGAGRRDLEEMPNLLRIRLGDVSEEVSRDRVTLIEANIDDMNPEVYGYLMELLLERGALDVYLTPVHMKKGRPGNVVSVLARDDRVDDLAATMLAETTTLGIRHHSVDRLKLERTITTVETRFGKVRLKTCEYNGVRRAAPEYEDCARLAREHEVPIQSIYAAAQNTEPVCE
jgi:uncharacterized protein (TIGR00299 family) protein